MTLRNAPTAWAYKQSCRALRWHHDRRRLALKWLDVAERKVNDNPANGTGSPSVPGLYELRAAIGILRRPVRRGRR